MRGVLATVYGGLVPVFNKIAQQLAAQYGRHFLLYIAFLGVLRRWFSPWLRKD